MALARITKWTVLRSLLVPLCSCCFWLRGLVGLVSFHLMPLVRQHSDGADVRVEIEDCPDAAVGHVLDPAVLLRPRGFRAIGS